MAERTTTSGDAKAAIPLGARAPAAFLAEWMDVARPNAAATELLVLTEKAGGRAKVRDALRDCVLDHFAGLEIIERIGGFAKSAEYIRNKLPVGKKTRSGDLGELLATEYIDQFTDYKVPIKKLRWKDDRGTTMRGNDVLAIKRQGAALKLLKAESKSRAALGQTVVAEAVSGLQEHAGRPNPSSLAFISSRLRELGRDDEAEVFESLQRRQPNMQNIEHMVFTLSGNVPTAHLFQHRATGGHTARHLIGCVIDDHQAFIRQVFDDDHA